MSLNRDQDRFGGPVQGPRPFPVLVPVIFGPDDLVSFFSSRYWSKFLSRGLIIKLLLHRHFSLKIWEICVFLCISKDYMKTSQMEKKISNAIFMLILLTTCPFPCPVLSPGPGSRPGYPFGPEPGPVYHMVLVLILVPVPDQSWAWPWVPVIFPIPVLVPSHIGHCTALHCLSFLLPPLNTGLPPHSFKAPPPPPHFEIYFFYPAVFLGLDPDPDPQP